MAILCGTRTGQHFRLARSDAHLPARSPFEAVYRLPDGLCLASRGLLGSDALGSGAVSQLVVGLARGGRTMRSTRTAAKRLGSRCAGLIERWIRCRCSFPAAVGELDRSPQNAHEIRPAPGVALEEQGL